MYWYQVYWNAWFTRFARRLLKPPAPRHISRGAAAAALSSIIIIVINIIFVIVITIIIICTISNMKMSLSPLKPMKGQIVAKPEPVGNLERRVDDKEGANQRVFLCSGVTWTSTKKGRTNKNHLLFFNGFVGQKVTAGPFAGPETSRVVVERSVKRRLHHAHVVCEVVAGELYNLLTCEHSDAGTTWNMHK